MRLLFFLFAFLHASPLSKSNLALTVEDDDFEISSNYIYELYDKLLEDFLYFDYLTEMIAL